MKWEKNRVRGVLCRIQDVIVASPINVVVIDAGQRCGLEFDAAIGVEDVLAFAFVIGTVGGLEGDSWPGGGTDVSQEGEIAFKPLRSPAKAGGEGGVVGVGIVHAVGEIQ